jgi:hypothetical protein
MVKKYIYKPSSIRPFKAHKSPIIGPPPPVKVRQENSFQLTTSYEIEIASMETNIYAPFIYSQQLFIYMQIREIKAT